MNDFEWQRAATSARVAAAACAVASALAACGGGGGDAVATPPPTTAGTHWDVANESTPAWQKVAYADGSFIAVGASGGIAQSSDGISWTRHDTAGGQAWLSAARGNGEWLALGSRGELLASADGATWTVPAPALLQPGATVASIGRAPAVRRVRPEIDIPQQMLGIVFGNDTFVASGESPIFASPDGVTWSHDAIGMTTVAFGGGLFVGSNGFGTSTSVDGKTWTTPPDSTPMLFDLGYVNGVFIGTRLADTNAYVSTDGVTWTSAALPPSPNQDYALIGSAGNTLYVSTSDHRLYGSADGLAWSAAPASGDLSRAVSLAGNADTVVVVSHDGQILSGPDVAHLDTAVAPSIGVLIAVDVVGGSTFAVSDDGRVFASADGTTWPQIAAIGGTPSTFYPHGIAHAPDGTIVVGGYGFTTEAIGFARSTDGHAWTPGASAASGLGVKSLAAVVHDGARFVAADGNCGIYTSATGETWTSTAMVCDDLSTPITAIGYGAGRYVIVGGNGFAATSTDAVHWTSAAPLKTPGDANTPLTLTGVAFDGTRFVASASDGHALASTDGTTWTISATATTAALTGIAALPGGPFVAVGTGGVAQSSTDGVHWTLRAPPASQALQAVAAGNGGFVAVGYDGLIEASTH